MPVFKNLQPGLYEEGTNGPTTYQANVQVKLETDEREYQLEERSVLEKNAMLALYVTDPGTVVETGKTQADGSVFKSACLVLRSGTTEVVARLYLQHILYANQRGLPFEISLPSAVNLRESVLEVRDEGAITDNKVIEFQVYYARRARR